MLVVFLFKRIQLLKSNSSINLSFLGSPRDEQSMYIKDFNCSWSTKWSYSRADIFIFLFICSKRISYLILVVYGVYSYCFDKDIHPFNSSVMISTWIFLIHLRILISSSSLILPFTSLCIISTWLFLLHLHF